MFPKFLDQLTATVLRPSRKRRVRSMVEPEVLEIRTVLTPALAGQWVFNGQPTLIEQTGTQLTFTNEHGNRSSGFIVSDTQVRANEWNLNGTLVGNEIRWDNQSVWVRQPLTVPDLNGQWAINGQVAHVFQSGTTLTFTNERGQESAGTFTSSSQVRATDWNLNGTVVGDNQINWANGSSWFKSNVTNPPDISGEWFFGNLRTNITQSGSLLTFTNEFGNASGGVFMTETQVRADAWGLTGTLVGTSELRWSNGTTWTRTQSGPTSLAGNYVTQLGGGARVEQNGDVLRFINEFGGASRGIFSDATHVVALDWGNLQGTLVGNQIRWANGSTWTKVS